MEERVERAGIVSTLDDYIRQVQHLPQYQKITGIGGQRIEDFH